MPRNFHTFPATLGGTPIDEIISASSIKTEMPTACLKIVDGVLLQKWRSIVQSGNQTSETFEWRPVSVETTTRPEPRRPLLELD